MRSFSSWSSSCHQAAFKKKFWDLRHQWCWKPSLETRTCKADQSTKASGFTSLPNETSDRHCRSHLLTFSFLCPPTWGFLWQMHPGRGLAFLNPGWLPCHSQVWSCKTLGMGALHLGRVLPCHLTIVPFVHQFHNNFPAWTDNLLLPNSLHQQWVVFAFATFIVQTSIHTHTPNPIRQSHSY